MGNAPLQAHEDLVHIRGWTRDQISSVCDSVRSKANLYRLTRDDFARYFGGRSREAITIFNDLDTDCDGLVDIFEIVTVLTLWSGTSWEDKQDLLFSLFDLMGKGFLKIDELLLMGSVVVQVLGKFVSIDPEIRTSAALKKLAHTAMPPGEAKLTCEQFRAWVGSSDQLKQLRGFIEDHAARKKLDTIAGRMRVRLASMEVHAARLYDRIERLQDALPDFVDACIEYVSAWGRRKRWDFLMQNLRQLILKLQQTSSSMHTTLVDLDGSLNEDELSGGTSSIVDPRKRYDQERMLLSMEKMCQESTHEFHETTNLLERLVELTEPSLMQASSDVTNSITENLNVIAEAEHEGMIDMAPPRVVEQRAVMMRIQDEMKAETQEGGCFFRKIVQEVDDAEEEAGEPAEKSTVRELMRKAREDIARNQTPTTASPEPPEAGGQLRTPQAQQGQPELVAIASFEPPASHASQMLSLDVGEKVTVIGQDGRGWWYGRKESGKEGWFPPSYVQLRPAHFSAEGAAAG